MADSIQLSLPSGLNQAGVQLQNQIEDKPESIQLNLGQNKSQSDISLNLNENKKDTIQLNLTPHRSKYETLDYYKDKDVGTLQNTYNAFLNGLVAEPVALTMEYYDHQKAADYTQSFMRKYPVVPGTSATFGHLVGGIVPVIGSMVAALFPITAPLGDAVLIGYAAQAGGAALRDIRLEEEKTGVSISDTKKTANVIGHAAANYFTMKYGLSLLGGAAKTTIGTLAPKIEPKMLQAVEELGQALVKGSKSKASRVVKEMLVTSGYTAGSFATIGTLNTVADNMIDKLYKESHVLDGVGQAILYNAASGAMLGPFAQALKMHNGGSVVQLSYEENKTEKQIITDIMKVATDKEIKLAQEHPIVFEYLIQKYKDNKEVNRLAKLKIDDVMDEAGEVNKDVIDELINTQQSSRGGQTIFLDKNIDSKQRGAVRHIATAIGYLQKKIPSLFKHYNNIHILEHNAYIDIYNKKRTKPYKDGNADAFFSPKERNIYIDGLLDKQTSVYNVVDALVHELRHSKQLHLSLDDIAHFNERFLVTEGPFKGLYTWQLDTKTEEGYAAYFSVSGEKSAFHWGENISERVRVKINNTFDKHIKEISQANEENKQNFVTDFVKVIDKINEDNRDLRIPTANFVSNIKKIVNNIIKDKFKVNTKDSRFQEQVTKDKARETKKLLHKALDTWLVDKVKTGKVVGSSRLVRLLLRETDATLNSKDMKALMGGVHRWAHNIAERTKRSTEDVISHFFSGQNAKGWTTAILKEYKENPDTPVDQLKIFTTMHNSLEFEADARPAIQQWRALTKWTQKWTAWFTDAFDVGQKFSRIGADRTKDAIKNYYSMISYHKRIGLTTLNELYKVFAKDKRAINKSYLIAEDPTHFEDFLNRLPKEERAKYDEAVGIWRTYFDTYIATLKEKGIITDDFITLKKKEIDKQLDDFEKKLEERDLTADEQLTVEDLQETLNNLDDLYFVHIPINAIFNALTDRSSLGIGKVLTFLSKKYRKNIRIRDLIGPDLMSEEAFYDLNPIQFITSYASRVGRDIALADIFNATVADGLSVKTHRKAKSPAGYTRGPHTSPIWAGHYNHPIINRFLKEMTAYRESYGLLDKAFSYIKMRQFIDPLFLTSYNIMQGMMAGAINPLRPLRTAKFMFKGIKDVITQSDNYMTAIKNTVFSVPFESPMESYKVEAENQLKNLPKFLDAKNPDVKDLIRTLIGATDLRHPLHAFNQLYQASWKTAWMFDNMVRMMTYNYSVDVLKMPVKEAAQYTAKFHADYASVPPSIRRKLNRVFFTPTFKITMAKLFANMIKGGIAVPGYITAKALGRDVSISKSTFHYGLGLYRTIGIMMAMRMVMAKLGYKEDEFGRRYTRMVQTDLGPKEHVVTYSGPFNMFLKYYYRAKASLGPDVQNSMGNLFKSMSWELNPTYRIAYGLIQNKSVNGDPIYNTFDTAATKASKSLLHVLTHAYSAFSYYTREYQDQVEARQYFEDEIKKVFKVAEWTRPFTYSYLRQIPNLRDAKKIINMRNALTKDIRYLIENITKGDELTPEQIQGLLQEYSRRQGEIIKKLEEYE